MNTLKSKLKKQNKKGRISYINDFRVALSFLSIIPLPEKITKKTPEKGLYYFPFIGLLFGFFLVGIYFVLETLLPRFVSSIMLVLTLIIITGGLHLDGFADTIEGLASGKNKSGILKIIKDSKTGVYGSAAVSFNLIFLLVFPYKIYHTNNNANGCNDKRICHNTFRLIYS